MFCGSVLVSFSWIPKDLSVFYTLVSPYHFLIKLTPESWFPLCQAVDQHPQDFLDLLHQFDIQTFQLWDVSEPGFPEPGLLHSLSEAEGTKLLPTLRIFPGRNS